MKFTNGQRGYVRCRVDAREWQTDYRVVPYVSRPGAGVTTRASFTVARASPAWPAPRRWRPDASRDRHTAYAVRSHRFAARASVQACAS